MLALTIDQLRALGITPLEILTLILVGGLITYIRAEKASQEKAREAEKASQEKLRESWHSETRAEVSSLAQRLERAELRGDKCEQDRAVLHREVEDIKRSVHACRLPDCPLRGR